MPRSDPSPFEHGTPQLQEDSAAEWFKVPQKAILRAFEEMAFKAHQEQPDRTGVADITQADVVCALMNAAPDTRQARIIEYIKDRAGLLFDRGNKVYCFPHRTFQEYLAARHLTEEGFPDSLVELARADIERWREAVLLAGAKVAGGTPFAAWSLAQTLCPSCDTDPLPADPQWWLTMLAGQLLVETGIAFAPKLSTSNQQCRRHIIQSLQHLVEGGNLPVVDRVAAGIALGKLGDTRRGVGLDNGLPDIAWIEIPPGPFIMGSKQGEGSTEEEPQFACDLIKQPYRISRYPVTVAQYGAFVAAGGYKEQAKRWWTLGGWEWKRQNRVADPADSEPVFQTKNHPRVGVSWYEAVAFCRWLSEQLKLNVTLPNEPEWERAARSTDGRTYPWGNEAKDVEQRSNIAATGLGHTSAVGLFPRGHEPDAAEEMAGNVWEWTRSLWGEDWQKPTFGYPYRADEDREDLNAPSEVCRVLRGGSWGFSADFARCACPRWDVPGDRARDIGFRVVALPFSEL